MKKGNVRIISILILFAMIFNSVATFAIGINEGVPETVPLVENTEDIKDTLEKADVDHQLESERDAAILDEVLSDNDKKDTLFDSNDVDMDYKRLNISAALMTSVGNQNELPRQTTEDFRVQVATPGNTSINDVLNQRAENKENLRSFPYQINTHEYEYTMNRIQLNNGISIFGSDYYNNRTLDDIGKNYFEIFENVTSITIYYDAVKKDIPIETNKAYINVNYYDELHNDIYSSKTTSEFIDFGNEQINSNKIDSYIYNDNKNLKFKGKDGVQGEIEIQLQAPKFFEHYIENSLVFKDMSQYHINYDVKMKTKILESKNGVYNFGLVSFFNPYNLNKNEQNNAIKFYLGQNENDKRLFLTKQDPDTKKISENQKKIY